MWLKRLRVVSSLDCSSHLLRQFLVFLPLCKCLSLYALVTGELRKSSRIAQQSLNLADFLLWEGKWVWSLDSGHVLICHGQCPQEPWLHCPGPRATCLCSPPPAGWSKERKWERCEIDQISGHPVVHYMLVQIPNRQYLKLKTVLRIHALYINLEDLLHKVSNSLHVHTTATRLQCFCPKTFLRQYNSWHTQPLKICKASFQSIYNETVYVTCTLSLSPAVWVSLCLSEPARSTRLSREVLILFTESLLS